MAVALIEIKEKLCNYLQNKHNDKIQTVDSEYELLKLVTENCAKISFQMLDLVSILLY